MTTARALRYLNFDTSGSGDGITTLEAVAATEAAQHAAVMAEVQRVLAWAHQHFPHTQGPIDDGNDWQHDVQVAVEPAPPGGAWHSVTLTLSGSDAFVAEFLAAFGAAPV